MQEQLDRIEKALHDIKKIMNGNGEMGCISKCHLTYGWMKDQQRANKGYVQYIVQMFIAIVVSFIAIKLGVK